MNIFRTKILLLETVMESVCLTGQQPAAIWHVLAPACEPRLTVESDQNQICARPRKQEAAASLSSGSLPDDI